MVAHQAPLVLGFSRREYWSGLPFPPPGALPDSGIKPSSLALQAESLLHELSGKSAFIYTVFQNVMRDKKKLSMLIVFKQKNFRRSNFHQSTTVSPHAGVKAQFREKMMVQSPVNISVA